MIDFQLLFQCGFSCMFKDISVYKSKETPLFYKELNILDEKLFYMSL